MPRRNRVDPWGDTHAVTARGMFTGNRGCLVDDDRRLARHHAGRLWITCVTEFKGRRHALDQPHRWTPLFFLDDAVALAAGHRPCGECRRADYAAYRDAVSAAIDAAEPLRSTELDGLLAGERLRRGRGLDRARDRITWTARLGDLPHGAVIVDPRRRQPRLVTPHGLRDFAFDGWGAATTEPFEGIVEVLTPPTSVAALRHGFVLQLHPTAESSDAGPHKPTEPSVHETWT